MTLRALSLPTGAMCLAICALTLAAARPVAAGLSCQPDPGRTAAFLAGEMTAGQRFAAPAGPGWVFVLEPDPEGWIIRLRAPDGGDLARITPPFHFVPNPRDLHGWHFRNRANTGPNEGDVNAPQQQRDFIFDRTIDPAWPDAARVQAARGRGELLITGFGLSPPEPGARAHFTRLRFEACLTCPESWDR